MKPIFAIDLTNDKKNDKTNGDEFIVRTVSSYNSENLEENRKDLKDTIEKSKLPRPLRILRSVCMYVGFFVLVLTLKLLIEHGASEFSRFYGNAPYVFWIGGVAAVAWIALSVLSGKRSKEVLDSTEAEQTTEEFVQSLDEVYAELGVPDNSVTVDVLVFRYVVKKGEIAVKSYPLSTVTHANVEVEAFVENGSLFIADVEHCFELPLSEITAIRTVKKTAILPEWHKDEEPGSQKYKQYKINVDRYGNVYVKPHYFLEIYHFGEKYGLYFPSYELPIFEKLTGLKAEEVK